MRTQTEEHLQRIGSTLNERARVLPMMLHWLDRAGMHRDDFARRINYSPHTLRMFSDNKYHHIAGSCVSLCRAIEEYIKLHPIEAPTEIWGELYRTENSTIIRGIIDDLLDSPAGCLLYGAPGTQKTFTLKFAVAEINREEMSKNRHDRGAYYVRARATQRLKSEITPKQLMQEIAIACGSSSAGDIPRIARNLAYDFRNRHIVLIIDEAQRLTLPCLETVRDLLDEPPHFSLLLAGMQDLLTKFDRYAAVLGQWNDRVIDKVRLPGLQPKEAQAICQREMPSISERRTKEAVELAIRTDAFDSKKQYINIRSLTGTLRQWRLLKQRAS